MCSDGGAWLEVREQEKLGKREGEGIHASTPHPAPRFFPAQFSLRLPKRLDQAIIS